MTLRMMISLGAASSALIAATPALSQHRMAQQELNYEERVYEYAQPAPHSVPLPLQPPEQPIVFTSDPVIQPVPAPQPVVWAEEAPAPMRTVRYIKDRGHHAAPVHTQQVEYEVETIIVPHHAPHHPAPVATRTIHAAPVQYAAPQHYAPPQYHSPPQHHGYAQPAYAPPAYAPAAQHTGFDRDAWLGECRDRIRGRSRGSNGGIIGGLLGAAVGAVVGNRVSSGERLAGTLIGGGIGGLAGLAIGSLIGGSGNRDRGECEEYLLRWESQQGQYGYYGHQGYAQTTYTMVPVTFAIPQRAIITEHVTTEYVTEYVTEEVEVAPVHRRVIQHTPAPAPQPTKRLRYIKAD